MTQHPGQAINRELRSLTGVRGVAALTIVAFHYTTFSPGGTLVPSPLGPCYLAVDLFSLMSGFVMAKTYATAFYEGVSCRAVLRFLDRRFARVYPLYAIVTLAVFAANRAGLVFTSGHPTHTALSNLLGIQGLGIGLLQPVMGESLIFPAWSISTEFGAYLVFPWLARAVLFRSQGEAFGIAAVCAAALVGIAVLHGGRLDVVSGLSLWPLVRCLAEFSGGLLLYRLANATGLARSNLADVLLLAGLAALWFAPWSDLAIVALFAALVWQICTDRSPLARLLGSKPAHRAGELSFAIYLLHVPASMALPRLYPYIVGVGVPRPWLESLVLAFIATIVSAIAAHRWIEMPARQTLRHVFDRGARYVARAKQETAAIN